MGFYIAREARDTASVGAGQISKLNAEFNESDKILYDGLEVSGSEVINVINKFKNDVFSVKVTTKKTTIYYIYALDKGDSAIASASQASVKDAQKTTSGAYINPNSQFIGEILRDANNTIIGISFIQS